MEKRNHGDRSATPKPLEELIAQHELEIEQGAPEGMGEQDPAAGQYSVDWRSTGPIEYRDTMPEPDIDAGVRMQSAAIAGGSFGAAGCFDDDILLRRANAVFNFIKNGLQ